MPLPNPPKPQFTAIQVFRGLAALWVTALHLNVIARTELELQFGGQFFLAGEYGVPFFFVLSGFIITWVHRGDFARQGALLPFAAKRIFRIYPLVWVVLASKVAVYLATGIGIGADKWNPSTVVSSFLLLPSDLYVIDVIWTLAFEVMFYTVFVIALSLPIRWAAGMAVGWAGVILWQAQMPSPTVGSLSGMLMHPLCLLFLAGCGVAALIGWRPGSWMRWLLVPGGLLLAAGVTFYHELDTWSQLNGCLFHVVTFSCLLLGAVAHERARIVPWPRVLRLFGDASYSIYLIHTSFQVLAVRLLAKAGFPFEKYLVPAMAGIGVMSVLGGLVAWRFVEVPLLRFSSRRIIPLLLPKRTGGPDLPG